MNDQLHVLAEMNSVGAGGACTEYMVEVPGVKLTRIPFQNGPVHGAGVNGWSNEVLLAIVKDRLEMFQSGRFNDAMNGRALDCIREAMDCLHERTRRRVVLGVADTHKP